MTDSNVENVRDVGSSEHAAFSRVGCLVGGVLAMSLWFFPFPVAVVVWFFGLKGLFADYMYLAIPAYAAFPFLCGYVVGRIRRPTQHGR